MRTVAYLCVIILSLPAGANPLFFPILGQIGRLANSWTAPTDISLSPSSIAENNSINDVVGTLSATDADIGDTFTYALVSGTGDTGNSWFNISGTSLRASISFDYEAFNSASIRVRATDPHGLYYEEALTVTITDVNTGTCNGLDAAGTQYSASTTVYANNKPKLMDNTCYILVDGTPYAGDASCHYDTPSGTVQGRYNRWQGVWSSCSGSGYCPGGGWCNGAHSSPGCSDSSTTYCGVSAGQAHACTAGQDWCASGSMGYYCTRKYNCN